MSGTRALQVKKVAKRNTIDRTTGDEPSVRLEQASRQADRWEERVRSLIAFKAEHGHCDVPRNYEADPSLTIWVYNCRRLRKQGKFTEARIEQLDSLGFSWAMRTRTCCARDWDAMVADLRTFREEFGHCRVPHRWPANRDLAAWLHGVVCNKRAGRLDTARVEQLNKLGVVWEPEQNRWEQMFSALIKFEKSNGHCNVCGVWKENPKLAKWVKGLRASYKRNTLSDERIRQLEAIGFEWERGGDTRWEAMFSELAEYRRVHGHCRVSSIAEGFEKLGNWVRTQRMRQKDGSISADQARRLNDLGFSWELWRDQWDAMFNALLQYKEAFGHCDVPQTYAENRTLGNWVITQRMNYKRGKLDGDQIERLGAIGFRFSVMGDRLIATPTQKTRRPDTRRAA